MFVGRVAESAQLVASLSRSRPTVVVGPPGIGKSALANAAARQATDDVVVARGIATLTTVPFLLFRNRVAIDGGDEPDDVADRLCRNAPGALVLDDLQWADPASLDVVDRIAGDLALVATVRAATSRSDAVLDRLERSGFDRIDLTGLADPEALELARAANPRLDEVRLAEIVDASHGSPLLLTELGATGDRSPTLTAALLDRFANLSEEAKQAMYRLSVLGRSATEDEVGSGVHSLTNAGLAHHRDGRHEVHHALLAELVLEQLGDRAHEVRCDLAAVVSDYEAALLLGVAGRRDAARRRALSAAEAARSPRDRAEALMVAIANAPDDELDLDHRIEVVQLLNDFGRPQEALDHAALDRIDGPDASPLQRGALIGLASYSHWLLGDTRRFAELIEESLRHVRGSRTEAEVRVLAGSTIYATWVDLDGRSALDRAQEAVTLADEIGEGRAFARLRLAAVMSTAALDGWADMYEEAIELAEAAGDQRTANEAATSLVLARWTRGDAAGARAVADRMLHSTPRHDQPQQWLVHAASAAVLDMFLGVQPQTIVDRWQQVLDDSPPFRTRPFLDAAVTIALADLGRDREAQEAVSGIVERAGSAEQWRAVALWSVAETAWSGMRTDEIFDAVAHIERLGVGHYPPAVMARLLAGHATVLSGGDLVGTEPIALMPAWVATPVEWQALVAESQGRWADAVTLFDDAARLYSGNDERSRLRCEWAAARAEQGGGDDPVDRLMAVERQAHDHGYRSLLHRVRPLLRRAGVARSAPSGRAPGGLTAREFEVIELVGGGRTSAQIAVELGISRDTVDDLVRSAMRRLGVSNRRAAVAKLRADGGAPQA